MKKGMLYVVIGLVVLFIIQVFRNLPVTDVKDDSDSPMYGLKRDTTKVVISPIMVRDEGTSVKDPIEAIKEKLFAYKYLWFANQVEYMVKDSDFVNPIIDAVIAEENDGKLPENTGGVEEIATRVIYKYRTKMNEPAGLERLENLIQKRYDNPHISIEKNGDYISKTVDLGVLPTKLAVSVRHGIVRTSNTGVTDESGRWISKEIARQILKYSDDFPDRIIFRVWFSPDYGGLEKSFLFTFMPKNPQSPFPPLIIVRPENYYSTGSRTSLLKTFYLFHKIEEYAADSYSVYEIDDYKYRQISAQKSDRNRY
ncbi:hypothetical protein [Emticicia agri]|uniref:Uncharacterized protein n=1 Tax=Emticicia agri TaxID=2492393 RepID=A0A4Q5M5E7_9BACT|nr:hypothetical protein [Emticicia agri]RYU97631.1 hypothetical protein EWM59_00475 [Emticicia agri]